MSQKIDIHYRNRSRVWQGIAAVMLIGLFQVAQAEVEVKRESSKSSDEVQAGREAYRNQDYKAALKELMPLAEKGNMNAQYYMGLMYANGDGVPKDPEEAERWFMKFSEQLGMGAKFNLGVMYYQGKSVPQDYQKAIDWFKRAAADGDAEAQFNLGYIYDNGYGVPRDREEAIKWYRKAADQGILKAQKNLGVMYSEGQGVAKNYVQAYFWFNVAAKQGDKSAASIRDTLAKDMNISQIGEAIQLTHEWKSSSGH